ncbi:MAG: hypothetical protein FWC58_02205 [Desulfobulbus sp.]|nr:hypothetical protein [Desulfobulbus sp.]
MNQTNKPRRSPANPLDARLPVWRDGQGEPLACIEKIRVMNDNFAELRQALIDALEDGILLGADEASLRACFAALAAEVPLGVTTAQARSPAFRPGSSESSVISVPEAPQTRGEEAPGFSPE